MTLGGNMFPTKTTSISGFDFGQKYPLNWGSLTGKPHLGVDYGCINELLRSPFAGKIISVATNPAPATEVGVSLILQPDAGIDTTVHEPEVYIRLCHLSSLNVKAGDIVTEGQVIATTGNTGMSTAPHLHLDISRKYFWGYWNDFTNFIDPKKVAWSKPMANTDNIQPPELKRLYRQITVTSDVGLKVRTAPRTGDETYAGETLANGAVQDILGFVIGEDVDGCNIWLLKPNGLYMSAKYTNYQ